ncbi:MAG: hypothetical protein ACRDNJ_11195 [Solirubrobacteraceae bacterium]
MTIAAMLTALVVALLAAAPAGANVRHGHARHAHARHVRRAQTAVPQGFVGVDADGPLLDPANSIDLNGQLATMVASGVQSIRTAFSWSAAEPYQSWSDVPATEQSQFTDVAGVPVDFELTDAIVAAAAAHHVSVLPTVLYAPAWDAAANPDGVDTPQRYGPYAAYLTALIGRYGPHGSFWRQHRGVPKMPIRAWQIWNEPNLSYYWRQPFARSYAGLLRAAHAAIRRADPGAKVVLGALTNLAWKSIGQLYRVRGARGLFDVVAVNGFTKRPANVILYLRLMRRALDRFHDGAKPLLATEISWPSARGHVSNGFDFDTTEAGQARNIATLLPQLGAQRTSLGLAGFYWYTWMGDEQDGGKAFDFAGLERFRDGQVSVKPALAAYRRAALALEGCRRKGHVATSCIR